MRHPQRTVLLALLGFAPVGVTAQSTGPDHGTVIIVTGRDPANPIPTLWNGDQASREISDQMFLRLADPGPELRTGDETSFVPRLAKSWTRPDPVTLIFDLDPRARWQDGAPVTAADVVFTFRRVKEHPVDPQTALLVRHVASVTALGDRRVTMKFDRPYPEQMYDATYHLPPLPEHLLARVPAESVLTSSFAANPIGNGPFKWKRRVPGQLIELVANETFFGGRPRIDRVIILPVSDPEARMNLLLSGAADATDNLFQFASPERLSRNPEFRMFPVHTLVVGYLLFNERDPSDTARPHPILGDLQVRRALSMALDRGRVAQTVFGSNTEVPPAPVSRMLWVHALGVAPLPWDTAAARALLAKQGWSDHDGDGVLDKDGKPLALSMLLPTSSLPRKTMALQAQEQLRRLGIRLDLEAIEGGSILDRLAAGRFDLFFGSATQDPSPRGLVQSWSCAGRGGTNYARYCNPRVDTLIDRASVAQGTGADIWRAVIEQIRDDAPAIFLYAPDYIFVIHRRFENVSLRTESSWLDLWKWSVKPGAQIDRDRQ